MTEIKLIPAWTTQQEIITKVDELAQRVRNERITGIGVVIITDEHFESFHAGPRHEVLAGAARLMHYIQQKMDEDVI